LGVVGGQGVASIQLADAEVVGLEERFEIRGQEHGHFLGILQWRLQCLVADPDPFVEMFSVAPSRYGVGGVADDPDLVGNEVGLYMRSIQVVEYEDTIWSQGGADHMDGVPVFALGFEVAEARKKIEGIIKAIGAKQPAHIVNVEMEVVVCELVGEVDGLRGQIDTGHIEALFGQDAGMPAPAASDIQQERTGWGH